MQPAAQKVLPLIAEMAVDQAVTIAAGAGYNASGVEEKLYDVLGYTRKSSREIGEIADKAVYESLVEKYGDKVSIVKQVQGKFADGTRVVFDYVVKDPKTGNLLEVVESKANEAALSSGQKKFFQEGSSVTLMGKNAKEAGVAGLKVSANTTKTSVARTIVNKFTGSFKSSGAESLIKKVIKSAK